MEKLEASRKLEMLREQAEGLLRKNPSKTIAPLSEAELLGIIHELEVHQIELELQNEEIMSAKTDEKLLAEKYMKLYDFSPTAHFTLSNQGEILELNHAGGKLLGKDRARLKGYKFGFFVSEGSRPIFSLFIEKVFQSGNNETCEVVLTNKCGLPVYAHVTGIAVENGDSCLLSATDISERVLVEKSLRESEQKSKAKLDALLLPESEIGNPELADIIDVEAIQGIMDDFYSLTKIGVAIVDLNDNILVSTGWQDVCTKFHRANPISCQNCRESDLFLSSGVEVGKFKAYKCKNNLWDVSTPIFIGDEHFGNIFLGQFFFEGEEPDLEVFRRQAEKFGFDENEYLKALDKVPRWDMGTVEHAMGFYSRLGALLSKLSFSNVKLARMIEDLSRAKKELAESESNLRDLNTNNDKLFSIIAHDLRSPFNSILGFSELLYEGINDFIPEEVEEFAKIINTSSKNALILLDNLLIWARSQRGQISFNRENVPLRPVTEEIIGVLKLSASIKDISLNHLANDDVMVYADRNMLSTVIRNLISNAIKFTKQGGKIDIYASSDENQAQISVVDNGIGMDGSVRDKLFGTEPGFTSKGTADEKGSGLGLVLCKELIAKHGGKIWAESKEGYGSAFHFTLPLR